MNPSGYNDIEQLILLSLQGCASRKELQRLNDYRSQSEQNESSYQLIAGIWAKKSTEPVASNYHELEDRIMEAGFRGIQSVSRPWIRRSLIYKIAASLVLLCLVSWYAFRIHPAPEISEATSELVVTYNPTGQKSKITLPDKSVIWLNAESSLSYLNGFTDSIRHIELEGEAYFEVEPDPNRPFVVETSGISTVALGTSFNIRNYPEENAVQVSLLSGQVKVTDKKASNEVLLKPLEQVQFLKTTRALKMAPLTNQQVSQWKDGIISFKASSFEKVIKTLERSYDVVIDTTGYTSGDWSYTAKFDNMSLEIVLTRIGYTEGFEFEIDGRIIKIFNDHG
jgi:ferric-dicitrate binding protein FerR (iron transport regulator)